MLFTNQTTPQKIKTFQIIPIQFNLISLFFFPEKTIAFDFQ